MTSPMPRIVPALFAALLGSSALVSGAIAQSGPAAATPDTNSCVSLQGLIRDNRDNLQAKWIDRADKAVEAGAQPQCQTYLTQAQAAVTNRNPNGTPLSAEQQQAAARIVVTEPSPNVTVKQAAPDVAVTQQQPEVTVAQGQPQIEVHQQQPTIHVQIPQPTITIDQPQPKIVVKMPQPDVAVNMAKPQVEVNQAKPQVNVSQAQPKIKVQPTDNGGPEANVAINQQQPRVEQQVAQGQPNVDVTRQQPQIQYFPAKPNIQVENQGKPDVRFNQTGQAQVSVEQMNGGAKAGNGQQQVANNAAGNDRATATDQQAAATLALLLRPTMPQDHGKPASYTARQLSGMRLTNWQGKPLGTVDRLISASGKNYVVLGPSTPLSNGNRSVVLPLETIAMQDSKLVMRGMTQAQIRGLEDYDASNVKPVAPTAKVQVATL